MIIGQEAKFLEDRPAYLKGIEIVISLILQLNYLIPSSLPKRN